MSVITRRDEAERPARPDWREGPPAPPRRRRPEVRRDEPAGGPGALAVMAFVLGVGSCLIFCLWPIGLVTSSAGLVCAVQGSRAGPRKLAVAGLVLSAVGLMFALGFMALTIAGISLIEPKSGARLAPPPFFPATP